jgi:hypothetical protein
MMNWKGFGKKLPCSNLRYYPDIHMEGLRTTMKMLRQDSRSSGPDMNKGPPEYEGGVINQLTTKFGPKFLADSNY